MSPVTREERFRTAAMFVAAVAGLLAWFAPRPVALVAGPIAIVAGGYCLIQQVRHRRDWT